MKKKIGVCLIVALVFVSILSMTMVGAASATPAYGLNQEYNYSFNFSGTTTYTTPTHTIGGDSASLIQGKCNFTKGNLVTADSAYTLISQSARANSPSVWVGIVNSNGLMTNSGSSTTTITVKSDLWNSTSQTQHDLVAADSTGWVTDMSVIGNLH
jgi:hypothetical protein